MHPFSDLTKDSVSIVKRTGERHGPYAVNLSRDECTIFDESVDVEHGDTIVNLLPNGKEEHYTVLRADFKKGFHGIPPRYKLTLQKVQQIHKALSNVVNNVNINHSTGFQVGSHNVQNIQNAFLELEKAIDEHGGSPELKSDAKAKLKALLQHPLVVSVLGAFAGSVGA